MASLLRRRPIAMLCSIFCRQQQRRYRFHSLCRANVTFDVGGQTTSIGTGNLDRFPNAAAVINIGNTQVISAVASSWSYYPVDYEEKHTPFMLSEEGQEGRELLCCHLIDRSIRALFPGGIYYGIHVKATVLSSDGMYDPDVMAANATSAALMLSGVPWNGPIGVIRVGRTQGKFIFNPTMDELSCSDLNLVYACTKDKTLLIDGYGWEITEKDLQTGLKLAHSEALKYIDPQIRLAEEAGRKKRVYKLSMVQDRTLQKIRSIVAGPATAVLNNSTYGKFQHKALDDITRTVKAKLAEECDEESLEVLPKDVDTVRNEIIRRMIIDQGVRVDGRKLDEVRPLSCESGTGPGFSRFYTGDTLAECTVTLEAPGYAQRLDWIVGPPRKHLMLDFSPAPNPIDSSDEDCERGYLNIYQVAFVTLAKKALLPVLPPEDDFPYDVYVQYDVPRSNDSTSMTIICGASMALMDAGVPLREPVAGVSVGLVSDMDPSGRITGYRILTDSSALEDQLGDMDFRIAGTRKGITAIQLDVRSAGIPLDIVCECFEGAQKGRNQILDHMEEKIHAPDTMLDSCAMALYRRMEFLTDNMERSYEMVRIWQEKLEEANYELREWKELCSQKEANEQRNDRANGDKEEAADEGNSLLS